MPHLLNTVPSDAGYRMPAEWAEHDATWIAWPHNSADWPGKFEPVPYVYAEVVRALAAGETVNILVNDADHHAQARQVLEDAHVGMENVRFHHVRTDRIWLRDSGPIFVTNGMAQLKVLPVLWRFNGWAKYDDHTWDTQVNSRVADLLDLPAVEALKLSGAARVVLEGGSIDVNGAGVVLTTEECLLSPIQARNPDLSREEIEEALRLFLGVHQVLWLDRGIVGDDTHGHVDDLARFTSVDTIVTVVEEDPNDENFEPLQQNLERLLSFRDLQGNPFRIVTLPMPSPVWFGGQRLPASYANFYIANAATLVPVFNDPKDRVALQTIQELIPDRPVYPIYCRDLVLGLGTLHCMTQQQPKAPAA